MIDYIFLERALEAAKVKLIKKADFNIMDCFKLFDWRNIGNINQSDMYLSLQEYFGYEVDKIRFQNQSYLVLRRFDKNNDSHLDFVEFSSLLLPVSNEFASILAGRPDYYMNRQEIEMN